MQKSEQSPVAIIGISIAAGKVPTQYYNAVKENPSEQASKQGHVFENHCSEEEEKKALQNVLNVLLQLHCFLASLKLPIHT